MIFLQHIFPFFKSKNRNSQLVVKLLLLVISFSASAQELTLALSQHPNKQAVLVAIHGLRKDTLGTILLDQKGKGSFVFKNKQPQTGLVNLTIRDKQYLSYDFVLSPSESPTLLCDMEYVYAQNTKILNSPENDCLNRWFDKVAQYKQRITLNQELSKLYTPEMKFTKQLSTEKQIVEKQLQKITDTINQSSLFAGKYMQFKIAQEEKLAKVWESDEQKTIAKKYFTQIDFDALYGSSMWFAIINSCIEAYVKESPYHQTFGTDIVENLKRIKNEQVYAALVDASISVTEKFGWQKDQETILAFILKDNRIKKPEGKLQKVIQSYTLSNSKKAPDLQLTQTLGAKNKTIVLKTDELNSKYSLLLFYQSDCGHCETTIEGLKKNYKDLVTKNIKIISIAGDADQGTFEKSATAFPWSDKYRDAEGMKGINFVNYGVIGTPTMYMIDEKGSIVQKMSAFSEVLDWITTH
jgi:peroxiredoxin